MDGTDSDPESDYVRCGTCGTHYDHLDAPWSGDTIYDSPMCPECNTSVTHPETVSVEKIGDEFVRVAAADEDVTGATTAGDLVSEDGCPECPAPVIRFTSPKDSSNGDEFECRNGHTWMEQSG